jgi:hypothetical protein
LFNDDYTPIGRDFSVIDVPLVHETSYDYDEMKGVVDDWANPYDQTMPIEVYVSSKPKTALEALGSQCKICTDKNSKILSVRRIRGYQNVESTKYLKNLVEDMIEAGKDPSQEFCIICQNCIMRIKKMSNALKSVGLSKLSMDDLERVFT